MWLAGFRERGDEPSRAQRRQVGALLRCRIAQLLRGLCARITAQHFQQGVVQEAEAELGYLRTLLEAQQAMAESSPHGAALTGHAGAPEWEWDAAVSSANRSASEMEEINDTIVNVFDKILFRHTDSLQVMPEPILERFAEVRLPRSCAARICSVMYAMRTAV